jgi:hypothetical protein
MCVQACTPGKPQANSMDRLGSCRAATAAEAATSGAAEEGKGDDKNGDHSGDEPADQHQVRSLPPAAKI